MTEVCITGLARRPLLLVFTAPLPPAAPTCSSYLGSHRPSLHRPVPFPQRWVSTQKMAWCDYCKVWLKDDTHSWAVHERGMKHKENVARSESGCCYRCSCAASAAKCTVELYVHELVQR